MDFNTLLTRQKIDPQNVLVMRHRPSEPELRKILPWLAAEKPDVYNAYQQTQGEKVEKAMLTVEYVASFIAHGPAKALFIGLYKIGASKPLTAAQYKKVPAYKVLDGFGHIGFSGKHRPTTLWFELALMDFRSTWKGKLVVGWPPPDRSWWRRAHRNDFQIDAILEESALDAVMPAWDEIDLGWDALGVIPARWRSVLSQWRCIYYIFDTSTAQGYVGSAYGASNVLGRWRNYAASGHGGNSLLRQRDPKNFRFTILQRLSPDMDVADVIRLESTWKNRLHSRAPVGLNDN